jgi:hypothetical protein
MRWRARWWLPSLLVSELDDGQLARPPGQERQVLADLDPGDGRRDGLQPAGVRVPRLGIPGVELARPALHVEEDAGARLALGRARGQREPRQRAEAELQEGTPSDRHGLLSGSS